MSSPRSAKKAPSRRFKRWLLIAAGAIAALAAGLAIALWIFNPRITEMVEGPAFRAEMDKQISKGLHFTGKFQPIRRAGFLTATSDGATGEDGKKAFKTIAAHDVVGKFNPLGVFLRRWQFDLIHIKSGETQIQIYEPKPEKKPPKPWYAIFLPDRVYLKQVICDSADITWRMNNKPAGFYGTDLLITPYGRDFEYHAKGGALKMPAIPDLPLAKLHMVITKEWLTLHQLDLTSGKQGSIHITGKAGLKNDKSVHGEITFSDLPLRPWLRPLWNDYVQGTAEGHITWRGSDLPIEKSEGEGELHLNNAKLRGIPFLDYVATAARNGALKTLDLDECSVRFEWKYPRIEAHDIRLEMKGQYRVEGRITLDGSAIDGTLEFGIAPENLKELPKAKELIFTRSEGGLLWTTVKLSGTMENPQNDLVPRLAEALRQSPGKATGIILREVGEWFEQTFRGKGD